MKYSRTFLEAFGYELAPIVVRTDALEARLAPVYEALRVPAGQVEALTGIKQRRWWEPGFSLAEGAARAGRAALEQADIAPDDVEVLIYAGVCREGFEPATAAHVAAKLAVSPRAAIYDLSNACLGVLNGVLDIANRIELGQIRAGLVVSCESAREINDTMIKSMLEEPTMERFRLSLATLTGGSGAVAMLLSDGSFDPRPKPRLLGAVTRNAPQHHDLCQWGLVDGKNWMQTDSVAVLEHGVGLGRTTWNDFLIELGWKAPDIDRFICHQVGAAHQTRIREALGYDAGREFMCYPFLGNTGTVALPITAALAAERGFLKPGHKVGFLGIGSGLNCLMQGWQWS